LPFNLCTLTYSMYLSDIDIEQAITQQHITLTPFDPARLQPASYDIRLGNKFVENDASSTHFVDPARKIYAKTIEKIVPDDEIFVLHPGVSVLGLSKEFFGTDHFLIQVGGKSSLARIGLMIHNTAGIINPGHFLNITFEITNQSNIPIILRPGMDIAQLTFSRLSSPPKQNYKIIGRFAADNWNNFALARPRSAQANPSSEEGNTRASQAKKSPIQVKKRAPKKARVATKKK
jgi:dCTP deaminase